MKSGRRLLAPLLALVIGLAASLAAALMVAQAEQGRRQARFEGLAEGAITAIESRMLAQLTLLRGAAGFFNATEDVTREGFEAYIRRLNLEDNYPGVLGIGYAAYAPDRTALDEIVVRARREGVPDLRAWPEGSRQGYSIILYLQPMNRLNAAALGYDMMSEPTRRAAMIAARDAGLARLSGRVRLVQEIDPVKQPGFLLYAPLYRRGSGDPGSADPETLYGWVYSPLRAHDLFSAIYAAHGLHGISVEIYDQGVDPDRLLYRSGALNLDADVSTVRYLDVAGRRWAVRVAADETFETGSPMLLPLVVGLGGALITLLIAALMLQQARAAGRIARQVNLRTAELRRVNRRLVQEARARAQAEEQVRQMQKMEAVGQLTGGIAHDFNNMLSVILGNLDIAERRLDEPGRLTRAIANARAGATKAAELTSRLLAFGRRQPLAPKVIDANRLLAGLSELLRRSLGETIRLEFSCAPELWRVHADPTQLESAIVNIAINARDAMPAGGTLTVETANCAAIEAVPTPDETTPQRDYVLIAIRDTGEGMTPEVAAKAMEPFFTTKEVGRGTGLGLSQVYGFVRQSGGYLDLVSAPGEGTTVKIYLPRHHGDEEASMPDAGATGAVPRGRADELILLVEDEDQVREVNTEALRDLGYPVITAPDGETALALLEETPEIRLLFTDLVMPGMNGSALAEAASKKRPDVKLLFTTGYAPEAIAWHDGLDDGVALLRKPFTTGELARKIRAALDHQSGGS